MPTPIKWTARSNKIVVYTGTLKNMQRYTGNAELIEKGILFGRGECLDGTRIGPWQFFHPCGALRAEVTFDSQGRGALFLSRWLFTIDWSISRWPACWRLDGVWPTRRIDLVQRIQ